MPRKNSGEASNITPIAWARLGAVIQQQFHRFAKLDCGGIKQGSVSEAISA
ncbi:MAG TPA: hypothetical protein VG206_15500 [Terriglobia bacterium]|nr:hypothetical protein [Terriglobia bacterium]